MNRPVVVGRSRFRSEQARRQALDQVRSRLGGDYASLYQFSSARSNGNALVNLLQTHYNYSPSLAVASLYPEHAWASWKFQSPPHRYWNQLRRSLADGDLHAEAFVRWYLEDEIAPLAQVKNLQDWHAAFYSLRGNPVVWNNLNRRFGGLDAMLKRAYAGQTWDLPVAVPIGKVEAANASRPNAAKRRKRRTKSASWTRDQKLHFFNTLLTKLGGDKLSFYNLTQRMIAKHKAPGLSNALSMLQRDYRKSVFTALSDLYAEHDWRPWKFGKSPIGWWRALGAKFLRRDPEALRVVKHYLDDISPQYGIKDVADWAESSFTMTQTDRNRLNRLGGLGSVLAGLYPDHVWPDHLNRIIEMKETASSAHLEFWHSPHNRRRFLEALQAPLNSYDSLYAISYAQVTASTGGGLLATTGRSVPFAIALEFPEHAWELWKFTGTKRDQWWKEIREKITGGDVVAETVVRAFLDTLKARLGLQHLSHLSSKQTKATARPGDLIQLNQLGGVSSLLELLQVPPVPTASEVNLSAQVDQLLS